MSYCKLGVGWVDVSFIHSSVYIGGWVGGLRYLELPSLCRWLSLLLLFYWRIRDRGGGGEDLGGRMRRRKRRRWWVGVRRRR